jgi:hypothetical protein
MNQFYDYVKCGNPQKLAEETKAWEDNFSTLGDDCRSDECLSKDRCWRFHIFHCADTIYCWHFGFRGKLAPQRIMEKGVGIGLIYFGLVADRLAKMTAETGWTEQAAWFEPYSLALLLATLAGRSRERTELSDFLHPALTVEQLALPHTEAALGDVLLCIAASFQSSSMPVAPLEERLQKSRKKRPKLLFKAWQALNSNERAKFVSAIADSTANFAKTVAEDFVPLNAVALQESILLALAHERGWTDLSFELPLAARLVTHESLELK